MHLRCIALLFCFFGGGGGLGLIFFSFLCVSVCARACTHALMYVCVRMCVGVCPVVFVVEN